MENQGLCRVRCGGGGPCGRVKIRKVEPNPTLYLRVTLFYILSSWARFSLSKGSYCFKKKRGKGKRQIKRKGSRQRRREGGRRKGKKETNRGPIPMSPHKNIYISPVFIKHSMFLYTLSSEFYQIILRFLLGRKFSEFQ